ncbi:MAG: response regulator [Parvularculaceae bacterium]
MAKVGKAFDPNRFARRAAAGLASIAVIVFELNVGAVVAADHRFDVALALFAGGALALAGGLAAIFWRVIEPARRRIVDLEDALAVAQAAAGEADANAARANRARDLAEAGAAATRLSADAAAKSQDELVDLVANRVRAPLNAVVSHLSVIAKDDLRDDARVHASDAHAAAHAALANARDAQERAALEAGRVAFSLRPTNVREVVAAAADAARPLAAHCGAEISATVSADAPAWAALDPDCLQRALARLVERGARICAGGRLELICAVGQSGEASRLTFAVVARGASVSRKSVDMDDGALAHDVATRLVDLMGGASIDVDGEAGSAGFALPLSPCDAPADEPITNEAQEKALTPAGPQRRRALISARDDADRHVLRAILSALNCDIVMVRSAGDAARAAGLRAYDVVLLSIDGQIDETLDAAREIRDGASGDAPIIALGADARAGGRDACMAAGVAEYLVRPIEFDAVAAAVSRAFAASPSAVSRAG